MPRRHLQNLKNLTGHAQPNTTKTRTGARKKSRKSEKKSAKKQSQAGSPESVPENNIAMSPMLVDENLPSPEHHGPHRTSASPTRPTTRIPPQRPLAMGLPTHTHTPLLTPRQPIQSLELNIPTIRAMSPILPHPPTTNTPPSSPIPVLPRTSASPDPWQHVRDSLANGQQDYEESLPSLFTISSSSGSEVAADDDSDGEFWTGSEVSEYERDGVEWESGSRGLHSDRGEGEMGDDGMECDDVEGDGGRAQDIELEDARVRAIRDEEKERDEQRAEVARSEREGALVKEILEKRGVVARFSREQVAHDDVARLKEGRWLNDEVINFYGALLKGRSDAAYDKRARNVVHDTVRGEESIDGILNAHYFSSFFWPKLRKDGYTTARLNTWTKQFDLFTKDIALMAVNHNNVHWSAAAINFSKKRIESYDSLGIDRPEVYILLRHYLECEHLDKKKQPFDFTGWEDYRHPNTPTQENGCDCGVFTCQVLERISRGDETLAFTQRNIPRIRKQMILALGSASLIQHMDEAGNDSHDGAAGEPREDALHVGIEEIGEIDERASGQEAQDTEIGAADVPVVLRPCEGMAEGERQSEAVLDSEGRNTNKDRERNERRRKKRAEKRKERSSKHTRPRPDGHTRLPPSIEQIRAALPDLENLLHPIQPNGHTYKDPNLDLWARRWMEKMLECMRLYTRVASNAYGCWGASLLQTATGSVKRGKGKHNARVLSEKIRAFIQDRTLPSNDLGQTNKSSLWENEMSAELMMFLHGCGKYVKAEQLVWYCDKEDVKRRYGLKKTIGLSTAKKWMKSMGFRWRFGFKGQFVDGHERADVVLYRQETFLRVWFKDIEPRTKKWIGEHMDEIEPLLTGGDKRIVVWFHDESTFYANDRRHGLWVHRKKKATPLPKGQGASLMISDFASADYGFLRFQDSEGVWDEARLSLKAGDGRDGYMTNDTVLAQTALARQILKKHRPDEHHFLVFDNATTHTKRADNALSARHMPKNPKIWGPPRVKLDTDGKPLKRKTSGGKTVDATSPIPMVNATFRGQPQPLYFAAGHDQVGQFKGMKIILEERGINTSDTSGCPLNAECKNFQCVDKEDKNAHCCCRRILFNQPDFVTVKCKLQEECEADAFGFLLLPKFHCELNFIELVWGHAKRTYRVNPKNTLTENEMAVCVLDALNGIPLTQHRKYARRCVRFMDGYRQGLSAKQAAWSDKQYHGHRMLPASLFKDLEEDEKREEELEMANPVLAAAIKTVFG